MISQISFCATQDKYLRNHSYLSDIKSREILIKSKKENTMPFKQCSKCKRIWVNRSYFLEDHNLILNGYQAHFTNIYEGLYLFTHMEDGCKSTISVPINQFIDLYKGITYSEKKTGSDVCTGKCLDSHDLTMCEAKCELAPIRKIIEIIQDLKK